MKVIVGLGNPDKEYQDTRHNIGFLVIDEITTRYKIDLNIKRFCSLLGEGEIHSENVLLVKPLTYMNRSGKAVKSILDTLNLLSRDIIVIHDDIDIPLGKIKKKFKGGDAGHKGIRSIIEYIGTGDFFRIRIGIGRPFEGEDPSEYVLKRIADYEYESIRGSIDKAVEEIEKIVSGEDNRL
ncbi:MAG: aminoacyl-tRNA hydrolase [Nitrospinae bacterium]|nr:aminoacyl-tRNA hydrolase [Nitrospinota bacterium]